MTNEQYTAKNWLMLLRDYEDKLKAEKRTLEILEQRLFRGVTNYNGTAGHIDTDAARAAHEDALADYSEQLQRIEKAQRVYIAEMHLRREVIDAIPFNLQALAIDRYINGFKWDRLEKLHPYSIAELYRQNTKILEHVAQILNAKQTPLTITQDERQEAAAV